MGFSPNTYDGAGHEIEIRDGEPWLTVEGTYSWQEGEYMNERNATEEIKLPKSEILNAAEKLQDD